jgi:2-polyprenyl-3-methyl-5-hydroxy-6-metoxy-1,4-benzoquinol methylase
VKQNAAEVLPGCPLCGGNRFSDFLTSTDFSISKEDFSIVKCTDCGLKFTNPRPKQSEIGPYYESEEYISHSNTSKGLINAAYQTVRTYTIGQKTKLYTKLVGKLRKTVLDYGCGTGELLKALKKEGWESVGIEPGDKPREFAINTNGLHVKTPVELSQMASNSFSIVSMWHVLEHIHDLHPTLEQINRVLSDDGRLIIAVPNSDSYDARLYGKFWAAYDLPRHLYHFNKSTIGDLLRRHNLEIETVKPMLFDAFYVSMLSEKYSTGKVNYFSALQNGLKSNFHGKKDILNFSSLIFIVRKSK